MTKKTCVALAVSTVALIGLAAAPAADALPIECSCDLCFEVPYYATCHLPWNNEVINCQSFVVLYCPVEFGASPAETVASTLDLQDENALAVPADGATCRAGSEQDEPSASALPASRSL